MGSSTYICISVSVGAHSLTAATLARTNWHWATREQLFEPREAPAGLGGDLRWPLCQNPIRVVAVIDDPRVVQKILRDLRAWHDPPADLSPPGAERLYTHEPCEEDPTPDYENVLTD